MTTSDLHADPLTQPWLEDMLLQLAEDNPDAARHFDQRSFMAPLHPCQRQGIWFIFHEAFHQAEHQSKFNDAARFAERVFADLSISPDDRGASDYHTRIVAAAISDRQHHFGHRLALRQAEPQDLAEPYEEAMRFSDLDYSPTQDEENRMARYYANREIFKAFGNVTRHTSSHPEAPLFEYREHFHTFILQRVANAIEKNDTHFDQAHTEELCRTATTDAQLLLQLLEGHTIYETPEYEPPDISPAHTTARTHTECLDAILDAAPQILADWPEFVTNTRTAAMLSDRSDLQSETAHGLLTILHRMVWPPPATDQ